MKENEVYESRLKEYGYEAFMLHREEVCLAVRTMCFCLEFIQNRENWSGRRSLARESFYNERLTPEKKEKNWEKYGRRARRKASRELEGELKERKWRMGEQEIPLKNFLRQGMMLMTEKAGNDQATGNQRFRLMESQAELNRFQDFREFLEAVYLLGFAELFAIHSTDTDTRPSLEGEHRNAERFLNVLKPYIPEEGQTDYDLFCKEILQGQARDRRKAMEQAMEERDEKLSRAVEELSLFRLFREAVENMEENELAKLAKPDPEDEICGQEHLSEEEQESIRREIKANRICNLAAAFAYGGSRARQRLLNQLSGEEQMLVMEQWMATYYPRDMEMLENRLNRMAWIAGLKENPWEDGRYSRFIREALEKLLGRPSE